MPDVPGDLASWLRVQFDADEALIRRNSDGNGLADGFPDYRTYDDTDTRAADEYIERFGPGRMLAEIDAKRRILDRHAPVVITTGDLGERTVCGQCGEASDEYLAEDWPCETVRLLAAPHAGRPGWQDRWAVA